MPAATASGWFVDDQNRNVIYDSMRRSRRRRKASGVAILCSPDAVVKRVLHDGLELNNQLVAGTVLSSILEPGSLKQWQQFLQAVQQDGGERSCRLKIASKNGSIGLWFSAAHRAGGLEIAAASTPALTAQMRREFFRARSGTQQPPRVPVVSKQVTDSREAAEDKGRSPCLSSRTRFVIGRYTLFSRSAELEKASAEKTRWILTAVHDLRNQLNSVLAYAELLDEDERLPAEPKAMVKSIHDSTEFLMRLLSDLEEIAWADSGKLKLQPTPTNVVEIIEESISLSRPAAEQKGTKLQFCCRNPLLVIPIDPQKIRHVLRNLLDNAIKYSQAGAVVRISLEASGRNVAITVQDNGPGIPADELNTIFTPFHKTRARAASANPGTGLGLAICKRIVEQHGGQIRVESEIGKGANFCIILPRVASQPVGLMLKNS